MITFGKYLLNKEKRINEMSFEIVWSVLHRFPAASVLRCQTMAIEGIRKGQGRPKITCL